jgi:dolichol-phosphate mannosyltransferase
MSDEAALALARGGRIRAGLRKPANWVQLVRFAAVGASGYAVNLAVFAVCVHALGATPATAATAAFAVAVTNNFLWNRGWTFRGHGGRATAQAARFLAVSLAGFAWNLAALAALIAAGLPSVPAQALAIATATPLTFLGNKLWTFDA